MPQNNHHDVIFKYLVRLPTSDCIFCSTQEPTTGRRKLFLIFNQEERIYSRNALQGTWDEIKDAEQYNVIRQKFSQAVTERTVPYYSTLPNGEDV